MKRPPRIRTRLIPVYFTMVKPVWWRRYEIWMHVGGESEVIFRSWSWDRTDDKLERLLDIGRESA